MVNVKSITAREKKKVATAKGIHKDSKVKGEGGREEPKDG